MKCLCGALYSDTIYCRLYLSSAHTSTSLLLGYGDRKWHKLNTIKFSLREKKIQSSFLDYLVQIFCWLRQSIIDDLCMDSSYSLPPPPKKMVKESFSHICGFLVAAHIHLLTYSIRPYQSCVAFGSLYAVMSKMGKNKSLLFWSILSFEERQLLNSYRHKIYSLVEGRVGHGGSLSR